MTPEKYRKIQSIIKALDKLAVRADEQELRLGNGGDVGSMISAIAIDLETELSKKCAA